MKLQSISAHKQGSKLYRFLTGVISASFQAYIGQVFLSD
jgi:hypothetical protein